MTRLVVGSATDVGLVRSNNQDQLLVAPGLYAVADGMGGHAAGEVASLTAIKALDAAFEASDERTAASLESAAKAANRAVWEQARTNRRMLGMGTTLVALAVVENDDGTNGLAVAHIGDSRLYLYRNKVLMQVTVDHSLVQELVDEGQISVAQAAVHPQRHVLTRALGVEPAVEVDLIEITPENNDRYLLCSDGLPREASDDQIAAILSRFPDPSEAAKELVELANSRGGSDNVTVVVVDVLANEQSPDSLIIVPGPASSPGPEISDAEDIDETPIESTPVDDANGSSPGPSEDGPKTTASHAAPARNEVPKRLNLRVVGFVVALCVVLGAAIGSLTWYARSAYFVGLRDGHIAIFQGRPGGVLWIKPTLSDQTNYSAASVLSFNLQSLKAGQLEPSIGQAHQYVANLVAAKKEAELADRPPPRTAPPTTARSSTTPVSSRSARPTSSSVPVKSTSHPSTTGRGAPTTRTSTTTRASTTARTGTAPHPTTTVHPGTAGRSGTTPKTTPAPHGTSPTTYSAPTTHNAHAASANHTTTTTVHKARTAS
jgi:PPM family protein phosphatase